MVSTDDDEIATIAKKYGAKIPFMRSIENSCDSAGTMSVLKEVIDRYKMIGKEYDYVCCLYPCAPFTTSNKLLESYNLLKGKEASAVIPVVQYSYPIQRSVRIIDDRLQMLYPENFPKRSQDLEAIYHDAGQFYFMLPKMIHLQKPLLGDETTPIVISELEVQDIDSLNDWKLAEIKFKLFSDNAGT